MAKYRPVDVRVWTDRKVASLSPQAKLLWLFLLTSPSSLPIPGVVIGGSAALSEQLGIDPELFDRLFDELLRKQLSVRREGRMIWLPKALSYQPPRNPNTVKAWGRTWDDIPDCQLKVELWQALRISCRTWSFLFKQLFHEVLPQQQPQQLSQEQDQDQDQEQDQDLENYDSSPSEPPVAPKRGRSEPTSDHGRAIDEFDRRYQAKYQAKPTWGPKQGQQISRLLKSHPAAEVIRRIGILFDAPPPFLANSAPDVGTLEQHFDKLATPCRVGPAPRGSQAVLANVLDDIAVLEEQQRKAGS